MDAREAQAQVTDFAVGAPNAGYADGFAARKPVGLASGKRRMALPDGRHILKAGLARVRRGSRFTTARQEPGCAV
jgi:hypothetical protein